MKDRLRAYLELVRVFLTPTALSDSLAGFVAAEALSPARGTVPILGAVLVGATSISLYWLGMAANDVFDRRKDAAASPSKPIPSGRVSPREAILLCVGLASFAIGASLVLQIGKVAAAVICLVLAYDAGGKNVPGLGNAIMGLCRAGNFLLGAAAAEGETFALTTPSLLVAAAALGAFIAIVTATSRLEDEPFDGERLFRTSLPTGAIPIGMVAAKPADPWVWLCASLLVWLLVDAIRSARKAAGSPGGGFHGASIFVRKALAGIFLVDAGLVLVLLSDESPRLPIAVIFSTLYGVAWLWKRAWLRRGSSGS